MMYWGKISDGEYGMVKGNVEKYGERKKGIRSGDRKVRVWNEIRCTGKGGRKREK